ncbi:hypothetical protein GCM10010385_49650 [Streptomyces geysiriensis]|uniref:hypothetical protein n=1 Tax=Streptomyces TaxID=1883 RepID=UPI0004C8B8C2|nr:MULTISPECIES: hypothetical protein [Streptomyces]MBJ6622907.1 hypothetical protein [Streptomyces sp. DHE17-7]RSS71807.1 hypothetical protein EF911_25400 [Streptomyces sp. WAC06128]GGY93751.1 hypothetical protein GCM10010385_49650 [Streptomyces geysiriensis]GHB97531.1 hypothetical protein GCM10010308_06490 [Streptomyces vinaceusdrappus]
MTDHRLEGPGENGDPVPRDMPDQQAGAGDDPWEAAAPTREQLEQGQRTEDADDADAAGDADGTGGTDVPDTDEAGTGRQGHPHSGAVHPEHPVPDESSG